MYQPLSSWLDRPGRQRPPGGPGRGRPAEASLRWATARPERPTRTTS